MEFRLELPGNVAADRVFADGPEEEGGAVAGCLPLGSDVVFGAFAGVVVQLRAFVLDDEPSSFTTHREDEQKFGRVSPHGVGRFVLVNCGGSGP